MELAYESPKSISIEKLSSEYHCSDEIMNSNEAVNY